MPVSAEQAPHVRLGALVAQGVASGNGRRVLPNAASLRLLRASRIAECGALAPFAGSRSRERRARRAPNTVVAYCRMRRPCAFCRRRVLPNAAPLRFLRAPGGERVAPPPRSPASDPPSALTLCPAVRQERAGISLWPEPVPLMPLTCGGPGPGPPARPCGGQRPWRRRIRGRRGGRELDGGADGSARRLPRCWTRTRARTRQNSRPLEHASRPRPRAMTRDSCGACSR